MYKLIVLDLDGTLTNAKKEITLRTKQVLLRVQQKGMKIVLASGRPTCGIIPLAEELELSKYGGFILSYNGGKIVDYKTKKVLFEMILPSDVIPHLYRASKEYGTAILSYKDKSILTEHPEDKYVLIEANLNKMNIERVDSFTQALNFTVTKCLMVGESGKIAKAEKQLQEKLGNIMSVYRSEPFFLELVPQSIDKAKSLEYLLNYLKISQDEIIACGDGYNDVSMIRFAGLGVAMANACDDVKACADYVTCSNEEDGVAHVVEKFVLKEIIA